MKRGMTGIITLAFAVLVLIVFMSAGALAATLLTSCGNITSSGEYVLANDVSSTTGCFMISASNVTLDCAGHTITFLTQLPNFEQVRAIYAPAWTTNDNIEIKNCKIVNGSSSNLSYLITLYEGIEVIGHNITIRDSYISTPGTSVAIWDNSNTSLITNNTIHSDHGTAIYARGAKISYNNVEAITSIYYGSRGIVAEDGSIVFSNTIFASAYGSSRGIQVTGNSQIYNNTITVVNGTGIIGGVGGTGSAGNSYVDIYDNFIYVTGAFPDGIYVQNSKNFTISSNQIFVTVLSGYTWNDAGILLYDSYNANYLFGGHELFNNTITAVCADECDLTAIRVSTSVAKSNNYLIYNNLFKAYGYANLSAVSSNSLNNRWNIEPIPGTNVVGGSYISGNAWLKSDNTGYSQECLDGNLDGLCDYSYTISGTNVDNNPIRINPFIGFQNELPIEGSIDYKITIAGTGTQQIYVCIDKCGEGGTPICDPVTDNVWPYVNSVTTEGVNCVRHQAIDRVGNLEDVKVNMIKIDKSNPIVTLEDLPEYDNDGFVNVVWDSVDAVSGIAEMEIYRNGLLIYTSENAIGNYVDDLSAPEYEGQTFSYYAVARDFAGRTANSNTVTTTISKISQPTTPTIIPLPVFTNALNVVVSWFRSIDLQGVNLYNLFIDNFITPFTSVSEPDPYGTNEYDTRSYSDTNVADGQTITYAVSATDNYGTESNQSERTSTTIDVSAPVTTKTIAPLPDGQNGWHITPFALSLDCFDAISGCSQTFIRINSEMFSNYAGTISIDADGVYNVDYYSTDNAGNTEIMKSQVDKLDSVAPAINVEITGTRNRCDNAYVNSVMVDFNVIEETSGLAYIEYKINDGAWTTFTAPFELSALEGRTHIITYRGYDNAGNGGDEKTTVINLEIDNDNDNYYAEPTFCPQADCNDADASINPGAEEIICDGIDQNCNAYWINKTFNDQLLVKSEHVLRAKSAFYDWVADGSRWKLFSEHDNDGLIIKNNEIALADFDGDGVDELLVKEKKWCGGYNCDDSKSWFYEWDSTNKKWVEYAYLPDDGLPLQGDKGVAACDILGNDGVPELVVVKEGFYKQTSFYHLVGGKWQLVDSSSDSGIFLQGGDVACGDYNNDGVQELIVKKEEKRGFKAYTWNPSTKKWVLSADYCGHTEPGDDLITGHSEIALGNVRGAESVYVDLDDRPDSDGDGVDDCVDVCADVPGNMHLGCPAAITTTANVYDCYWNNIRGTEAREGQEIVVAEKSCVDNLLAAQFPATPSWESLTSQIYTHKENELNAIMASNCVVRVCFADDSGECTVGVDNGNYVVFGPFATTQWVEKEKKVCYEHCCGNKKGKHSECTTKCNIEWTIVPEQFTFSVFRPVLAVSNSIETAHLDFIKLWWDKIVPAVFAGTIVGSELNVVPAEFMVEVPAGETPPAEMNVLGDIDYIYPILLEADSPWEVDIGVAPPEGYNVSTETSVVVDDNVEVMTIGLEESSESSTTGQVISGRVTDDTEDTALFQINAKHPGEAVYNAQTVKIRTTFEPPAPINWTLVAVIAIIALIAVLSLMKRNRAATSPGKYF